ncbi:MAG: ATP-binding cassette domain-containing protein [Alphaproteobacteria bacterium]
MDKTTHMPNTRHISIAPLIECEMLSLQLGGRIIVENVNIAISPGEIVTLIGPNGAGKTSLVRMLLGLVTPDSGTITKKPGLTIGYVPQRFAVDPIVPLTVERFLRLSGRGGNQTGPLLEEVGAGHLGDAQISALSGGEFQRVLVAKALMGNPQLLVLDEPAQNVDFSGEAELYRLIEAIRDSRGCGILMISHNLHVVLAASDRVVCLNHHVCCSGVPESVAKHPEYERLFGAKAAQAFAIYSHTHDHEHDLSGNVADPDSNG